MDCFRIHKTTYANFINFYLSRSHISEFRFHTSLVEEHDLRIHKFKLENLKSLRLKKTLGRKPSVAVCRRDHFLEPLSKGENFFNASIVRSLLLPPYSSSLIHNIGSGRSNLWNITGGFCILTSSFYFRLSFFYGILKTKNLLRSHFYIYSKWL